MLLLLRWGGQRLLVVLESPKYKQMTTILSTKLAAKFTIHI